MRTSQDDEPEQELCATCARYGDDCEGDDFIFVIVCTGYSERQDGEKTDGNDE